MSYFDNLRVIAQGGGSDQARACRDKKCPQCDDDDDWGEDEEKPSSLECITGRYQTVERRDCAGRKAKSK